MSTVPQQQHPAFSDELRAFGVVPRGPFFETLLCVYLRVAQPLCPKIVKALLGCGKESRLTVPICGALKKQDLITSDACIFAVCMNPACSVDILRILVDELGADPAARGELIKWFNLRQNLIEKAQISLLEFYLSFNEHVKPECLEFLMLKGATDEIEECAVMKKAELKLK